MWAVVEGRGRRPSHTFLDYGISYLLTAVVVAFTAGQIGSPSQGYPNIATQMGQSNAPLAAFALLGGVSAAVGDLCMLFSVALLGLAVGPASINAIGIVAGSLPLAGWGLCPLHLPPTATFVVPALPSCDVLFK